MSTPHYPNLGLAIRGVCQDWCEQHGYSDPFCRDGIWWAFPPDGVMLVRIETVMEEHSQRWVRLGPVRLILFPDGSIGEISRNAAVRSHP
ncbi:MAG: hypothetical protein AAFU84_11990 [Cyanobacteria bacterium J06633_23]